MMIGYHYISVTINYCKNLSNDTWVNLALTCMITNRWSDIKIMIPRNENLSLSSSKHIILSVVTYKLYLQQKKKPQRKFWIWKPGFNMLTAHLPVKKTSYRKLPIKIPPSGEQYYSIQKHKVRIFLLHSLWNKAKLPDTPRSLPLLMPFSGLSV